MTETLMLPPMPDYRTDGLKPDGADGEARQRFELASPYGPELDDDGLDRRFASEVLRTVREGWNEMHASNPDFYVGMTVFGSAVKGRIHEGSDVDGMIFVDMDSDHAKSLEPGTLTDGPKQDVGRFILPHLQEKGYGETFQDGGSYRVMGLSQELIELGIKGAETRLDRGVRSELIAISNSVTAMFCMRVGEGRLQEFRKTYLDRLSASKHGETIWNLVMDDLRLEEEKRRDANIYLPRSLDEAYGYFNIARGDEGKKEDSSRTLGVSALHEVEAISRR